MRIEKSLLIQRILLLWFWVLTCTGFINDELLGFSMSIRGGSLLLTDIALLLLALWTIREKWDYIIIGLFMLISWWSTCVVNGLSLVAWINGSRVFYGMLFLLPIFRYFWQNETRLERFVHEVDKSLFIFLVLQAFCIVWQFSKYGSGDHVGGSFGNGFSGMVSVITYIVSFYLLQKRIDNNRFFYSLRQHWYLIALLLPTFLNETKISFVLIIIYFMFLTKVNRKWFSRILVIIPIAVIVLSVGFSLYFDNVANPTGETDIEEYFVGQDLEYEMNAAEYAAENNDNFYDIPRIAKIAFIGIVFQENPGKWFWGFGVSIYKGHQNLEENPFSKTYDWLVGGTNPYLCHVAFQLGTVGIIFFAILFASWFMRRLPRHGHRNHSLQLYLATVVMIMLVYSDFWRETIFCYFFLILLCLSWDKETEATGTLPS